MRWHLVQPFSLFSTYSDLTGFDPGATLEVHILNDVISDRLTSVILRAFPSQGHISRPDLLNGKSSHQASDAYRIQHQ